MTNLGVGPSNVALIPDAMYYGAARGLVERSARSIRVNVFIVDVNAHHDPAAKVSQLFGALECAVWRGVDVRVLIGGSRTHLTIAEACLISREVARSHGIDCRVLAGERSGGSHAKYLVADDWVLGGSHNWSRRAFSNEVQDSLLIESRPVAAYLVSAFEVQWSRAGAST